MSRGGDLEELDRIEFEWHRLARRLTLGIEIRHEMMVDVDEPVLRRLALPWREGTPGLGQACHQGCGCEGGEAHGEYQR